MKMIIADLDGTLVYKKEMSDTTLDTIQKLQQNGYLFTLATGRHKDATKAMVEKLQVNLPVICTNGAFIYDFKKEQVIHQDVIDEAIALKVMSILEASHTDYLLYTTQSIVSTVEAKNRLEARIGTFDSITVESHALTSYVSLGLLKILIIEPDSVKFDQLRQTLSQIEAVYVLSSQPSFIDVGNKIASKGRALEILCQYLSVPLEQVLAIGDQENDLTMVQKAGLGIAMGDGEDALKRQAKFVTKPFKEDGFTHAINTFIFKD